MRIHIHILMTGRALHFYCYLVEYMLQESRNCGVTDDLISVGRHFDILIACFAEEGLYRARRMIK